MGPEFPGPASDAILAWTLRLGTDRDPALAAKQLLATYDLTEGPLPEGACGEVVELLRQAAASDGQPATPPNSVTAGPFLASAYSQDIIWADGFFVKYPAGSQVQ